MYLSYTSLMQFCDMPTQSCRLAEHLAAIGAWKLLRLLKHLSLEKYLGPVSLCNALFDIFELFGEDIDGVSHAAATCRKEGPQLEDVLVEALVDGFGSSQGESVGLYRTVNVLTDGESVLHCVLDLL